MASSSETIRNCDSSTEDNKTQNIENGIKLPDLKVQDLKVQLEKRNLDKTGVKSVLFERLKSALIEEGENPDTFTFDTLSDNLNKQSSSKKNKVSTAETNGEVHNIEDMNDSIEVDIKDEIIDDIIDINIDTDEKCSNEVTLQLSIDEEDAQLNDEENILDISKVIDNEPENKSVVEKPIATISDDKSVTKKASPVKTAPQKAVKPLNEQKVKKKIPLVISSSDSPLAALSKASKVLGKSSKTKSVSPITKSLLVTGLPSTTRAADLKILFSKQGRVLSVKIVKSAKQTPGKWFGFVTMASSKDATKAIQNLHHVELNGHTISVEKSQSDPSVLVKKLESKLVSSGSKLATSAKKQVSKDGSTKSKMTDTSKVSTSSERRVSKQEIKTSEKKSAETSTKSKDKKVNDKSKSRDSDRKLRESKNKDYKSREVSDRFSRRPQFRRPPSFRQRPFSFNERPRFGASHRAFAPRPYSSRGGFSNDRLSRPSTTAYSLQKIREERLRLRAEREIEKRRLEEITHHRFIERKQREEAYRLEREKEKLRLEREMLEREKAEILKLEREKQRLERERLERERDELRRQAELRRSAKRPIARVHERQPEQFWKKPTPRYEARSGFTGEPTTNTRYDYPSKDRAPVVVPKHDYERRTERYNPKTVESTSRVGYDNRESRREVTIRSRDERQVYDRSIYRADRDARPSFPDRERHSTTKRESSRIDWKHDRRVHERVIPSTSNSSSRRMYY